MVNPKTAGAGMAMTGLLNYFTLSEIANMAKGTVDAGGMAIEGAWNKRDDTFQEAGSAAGEIIGTGLMAGANFGLQFHEARTLGWQRGFFGADNVMGMKADDIFEAKAVTNPLKGGSHRIFNEMEDGTFRRAGSYKGGVFTKFEGAAAPIAAESRLGQLLSKSKFGGVLRGKGFHASPTGIKGLMSGMAPFIGAFAVGQLARGALGFAGSLVDQAAHDYHRQRSIHYDSRFFNTQRDQQSAYNTLGMAMNNYENRMQSTARIFHSR